MENAISYSAGNSALLNEYRATLIKALELGEVIKGLYGIVPPTVLAALVCETGTARISLNVTKNVAVSYQNS